MTKKTKRGGKCKKYLRPLKAMLVEFEADNESHTLRHSRKQPQCAMF
jgi:hypothetical protein